MEANENPTERNSVIRDIFTFFWIPLMPSDDPAEYEEIGTESSATQFIRLVVFNSVVFLMGLRALIGGNPWIDLGRALDYLPFNFVFAFLALVSSLTTVTLQFICFRLVSGKANLVAHGYLTTLATSNIAILLWVNIAILYIIPFLGGIVTWIMGIGGIYLLVPSFLSLKFLHKISTIKTAVGFVLSIFLSAPLIILNIYLIAYFAEFYPYQIHHWWTMFILSGLLLTGLFILAYILWEKELESKHTAGVPIWKPVEEMLRFRWVQIPLGVIVIFLVLFLLMAIGFPDLEIISLPIKTTLNIPIVFIIYFVLIYTIWEEKLFFARPENVSLEIPLLKRLVEKRERVFLLGALIFLGLVYRIYG